MTAVLASIKYQMSPQQIKKTTWTVFTLWNPYPRGRLHSLLENEWREGNILLVVSSMYMMSPAVVFAKTKDVLYVGVSIEDDCIHVFESY